MDNSGVGMIGVSYKTSPVEVRERLSINEREILQSLRWIFSLGAREAVILSTCNRVEIYFSGDDVPATASLIREAWEKKTGRSLESRIQVLRGFSAIHHLFRVAAGLDSMVLGESQILAQVKGAYALSLENSFTGKTLNRIFQKAVHAGKLARARTQLSNGITSVPSAAVVLAEKIFGDLSHRTVMVLGAGKMAEAAAKHLNGRKVKSLFVANRTYERALELASALGAEALRWEEGMSRMKEADIVLCSTSCPTFVLTEFRLRPLMKERRGRPLFLIDIAVPRDVEPAAGSLEGVYLYDIDDLKEVVQKHASKKKMEAEKAEALVRRLAWEEMKAVLGISPSPVKAPSPDRRWNCFQEIWTVASIGTGL